MFLNLFWLVWHVILQNADSNGVPTTAMLVSSHLNHSLSKLDSKGIHNQYIIHTLVSTGHMGPSINTCTLRSASNLVDFYPWFFLPISL